MGPGENAGAVDVGGGLAVAFKVESHNHPSAVEPFQGAATGVGGILRDVFAIGARPIAVLDSLRFGDPASERSRYLLDRAVAGIGHYGNSIGVPTVGGEVYFEGPYEQNCLINAMCVGLAPRERLIRSAAAGPGNLLVLLGASTGPRRHRRRLGAGVGRAGRGRRGQAPERADRRPVRGEEADGVLPRAARPRTARLAAGPGRRRPDLRRERDGEQGRRSASRSTSRACRCASRGWSPSRSWSRSPRSGCCASSSPSGSPSVVAVCEHWETAAAAIGSGDRAARSCGSSTAAGVVGEMPVARARRRVPDVHARPRSARRPSSTPRRCACSTSEEPDEVLLALLRSRQHRRSPPALRAVRLRRAVAHGAPPGPGRRRGARAAGARGRLDAGDRDRDRRQRPARRRRPLPRHDRGRARVRGEPRVRRRGAARPDQLPELRQPREAAHRLAADRVGARAGRRLPGAGDPGRRRQRLALQRGRGGPDLPDAGRRAGRRGARRAPRRVDRLRDRGRPDRARRLLRAGDPRLRARAAGRRRAALEPPRVRHRGRSSRRRSRSATRCAPARSRAPTTSPRAASRRRSRSAAWRARSARRSSSPTPSSRCARCSARRPAASSSADRSPRCACSASASS